MKKIVIMFSMMVSIYNIGYADTNAKIDVCSLIIPSDGDGAEFDTKNSSESIVLYYDAKNGDGISGVIVKRMGLKLSKAHFIDSHCNSGKLVLNWSENGFSGNLKGKMHFPNLSIDMTGYINNIPETNSYYYRRW